MDENTFWAIIDECREVTPYSLDGHEAELVKSLDRLNQQDFQEFIRLLMTKAAEAEVWSLWAVAWIVRDEDGNFGCSDDEFWAFTVGLVCQGQGFYLRSLEHPDSIASFDNAQILKNSDGLGYAAVALFGEKYGELSFNPYAMPVAVPSGLEWNPDDMNFFAENFPNCVSRWGLPE